MNALASLSERCGILASFTDARGVTQTMGADTRLALLAAMGFEVTDEEGARQALVKLEREQIGQELPPVYVHYESAGPVEINMSIGTRSTRIAWRVDLEDGSVLQGVVRAPPPGESRRLRIEEGLPCGYHTLTIEGSTRTCSLIVTPGECWLPERIRGEEKLWGISLQVYLLRSQDNWGIGDYGDVQDLVQAMAGRGADLVGVNPLHALFVDDPEQASPYSPASRYLLNILNIDVMQVAESMSCPAAHRLMASAAFQDSLSVCREAKSLDYTRIAELKIPALKALFECCDHDSPQWDTFAAFCTAAGETFERHCLFLALRQDFSQQSLNLRDWHQWPQDYRSPQSPGSVRFAKERAQEVTFQAWLQFVADSQLLRCREAAAGMAVGLYRDLAVGSNRSGAETWSNPLAVVDRAQVGAPPDIYNPQGQNWGLPPFNPRALRDEGYKSFIELLRANMRHAGALRIDHVMALQQLYWIPTGAPAAQGAYVRYPLEDLVGILALESVRQKCMVVGEDLGTVPEGFRERMQSANVFSYRVLFFEKDEDGFIAPGDYPKAALAVAGSHDLPTLRSWWRGEDLMLKERLSLFPTQAQAAQAKQERDTDRNALEQLLRARGLVSTVKLTEQRFVDAAHALLAGTACAITMLQLDDLTGEVDPVNVPTTSDQYPNWRRRLSMTLDELLCDARFVSATKALTALRERRDRLPRGHPLPTSDVES